MKKLLLAGVVALLIVIGFNLPSTVENRTIIENEIEQRFFKEDPAEAARLAKWFANAADRKTILTTVRMTPKEKRELVRGWNERGILPLN